MPATDAAFDLTAYLERIGLEAAPEPSLEGVRRLAFAHATHIPFENLDAFVRKGVDLALPAVVDKLVHQRRGGWCFEQNLLFGTALRAIGVPAEDLAAVVLWNRPPGHRAARTHRLLTFRIGRRLYVADVGFGVMTLTGVLSLEADAEQQTPHEIHRLATEGAEWRLDVQLDGDWRPVYRFTAHPWQPEDFGPVNYQLSHDPQSPFVQSIALARATPTGRLTLRDLDFTRRERGAVIESRRVQALTELLELIECDFGLPVRAIGGLEDRCGALFAPGP